MELTTPRSGRPRRRVAAWVAAVGIILALGGCASQATLDRIDAKFDRILAENCGGDRGTCWLQERNRILDKEYANSPMQRLNNYFAHTFGWGGGAGAAGPTHVLIVN